MEALMLDVALEGWFGVQIGKVLLFFSFISLEPTVEECKGV